MRAQRTASPCSWATMAFPHCRAPPLVWAAPSQASCLQTQEHKPAQMGSVALLNALPFVSLWTHLPCMASYGQACLCNMACVTWPPVGMAACATSLSVGHALQCDIDLCVVWLPVWQDCLHDTHACLRQLPIWYVCVPTGCPF